MFRDVRGTHRRGRRVAVASDDDDEEFAEVAGEVVSAPSEGLAPTSFVRTSDGKLGCRTADYQGVGTIVVGAGR